MKKKLLTTAIFALAISLFALPAFGQGDFSDPNAEYTFTIPSDSWKMTVKPSRISPNVEYVYRFRNEGHLEVRKTSVDSGTTFDEIIREEEQKLQFKPGYVAGRDESFKGAMEGRVFNYEFVRSGRNMSGRFYFLKADPTTVYILRFTGERDSLRTLRNETDLIARTFKLK
ncbi:MAG: hypothetical protein IPM63_10115 [Acidobacteriota bacterium]|nr:MAG: hypothetical protein IPM63_10115 [Acidobacteriota bacterium]